MQIYLMYIKKVKQRRTFFILEMYIKKFYLLYFVRVCAIDMMVSFSRKHTLFYIFVSSVFMSRLYTSYRPPPCHLMVIHGKQYCEKLK